MTLARMKDIQMYRKRMKNDNINVNIIPTNILSDDTWQKLYKDNADVVDNIAYKLYSQYVMEDVQNPLELNDYNITVEELTENAKSFMLLYKTTIDKLYELESITFSPIENYDRYEDIKDIRTGNEVTTLIKTGSSKEVNTTNGNVSNAVKNNQKEINKSEPTSYNTNLIDTVTTEYSGDSDTSTTTYNALTHEKETTYNNVKDDNTHSYNDVTDSHNAHIHGNIGVTTATAMMREYVDFYSTYNFWNKFWELYIHINCRADFDNMIAPL